MNLASLETRVFSLVAALFAVAPLGVGAGEHHRKGEGAAAKVNANTNAVRAANAAEHKAMAQQQAAIHRNAQIQQQHEAANRVAQERRENGINGTGVGVRHNGVAGGVAHRNGVGVNQHRNMETGPMVSSIHSVIGRLHQADHDYDGHRVQAIHQLEQAVHTLNGGGRTNNAGGTSANRAGVGARQLGTTTSAGTGARSGGQAATSRMSQAESDAHLRQAHQELVQLESHMSNNGGTTAGQHHQQAHTHVREALQHLNRALATR